ncbi:hypothetical protein O3Q51_12465 [Cryomorphaceae bacterium 1068]|nr:hypothetical protein [Cryomorphaceae bacterium 1068]
MEASKHSKRWLTFAPIGLILIGSGLSMAIDAGFYRMNGAATIKWVLYGTCALIVFNAGLSFFGQAIIEKIKHDQSKP